MGKLIICAVFAVLASTLQSNAQQNVILFVADGLRAAAVTPKRAPAFARVRDTGVNFSNSHSVYPTITTVNASVIATGHLIGDTGDFGNTFYTGFPVASAAKTVTPFIQDNAVLSELNRSKRQRCCRIEPASSSPRNGPTTTDYDKSSD